MARKPKPKGWRLPASGTTSERRAPAYIVERYGTRWYMTSTSIATARRVLDDIYVYFHGNDHIVLSSMRVER